MFDFILGLALAALAIRGWFRGFIKEIFDLIGLVAGVWIAFRLSPFLGDFLTQRFGVVPEAARIAAGVLLFFLFGISLAIGAHFLTKAMSLPGLNVINRVGGALVAGAWGVVILLVAVNVLRVIPLPDTVEEAAEDSTVIEAIAGPEALPQQMFERLAGDTVLFALQNLQDMFGASRLVPEAGGTIEIPPAQQDEIRQVRSEADSVFGELNSFRVGEGMTPYATSPGLRVIAEERAAEIYQSGQLERMVDCLPLTGVAAGAVVGVCTDLVGLAGTALAAFDAILVSEEGEEVLSYPFDFDRAGVAVVDGPLGRLLVIILGG